MMSLLHSLAQLTVAGMVDSLVEGTFVGLFAATVLRATRRYNAATRFAVCFSGLIAIAIIPLLGGASHPDVSSSRQAAITISESWAVYLFAAWAVIAGFFFVRLGNALRHLRGLRQTCSKVDPVELDPLLQKTLRHYSGGRQFVLCTSDAVRVPTAIGLFKPAIVIPRWVLRELSAVELNQILLHEIAHVRRFDDWTNLAQQLVRAVFFFHPAVWWIEKRVALEREMACDDAVLEETASARAYAECLANLAEKSFVRRTVMLAQAALGRVRQTSLRVAQILSPDRPQFSRRSWKPAVALVAGFAVAAAVAFSRAPRLIVFQDSAPARSIAISQIAETNFPLAASSEVRPLAAVVLAKLNVDSHKRTLPVTKAARSVILRPRAGSLVHLTRSEDVAPPMIQTLFVVIETRDTPTSLQIQMWHLLVLHPAVDPDLNPPQKKT